MSNIYYYKFWIGAKSFSRYGLDDRKAKKIFARYLRMMWLKKSNKEHYNHFPENASISRVRTSGGLIIPDKDPVYIESFNADETSIMEFYRVWK